MARALILVLLTVASLAAAEPKPGSPNPLGIEGSVSALLPKPDYQPKPLDDRTELILRIENVSSRTNGAFLYQFHFLGFEPGSYNLVDYLVRPDGSRPEEIGEVRIKVQARLPEDHNGRLQPFIPQPFPWIGGYRMFLGLLGLLWAGGIVGFVIITRKKEPKVAPVFVPPEPSFAERLRPLVEAAAKGQLSIEGRAQLERLLIGYWRERLSLRDSRMAEAIARLKGHPEAGELLRALERWLHRPSGASTAEVAALLEPYRNTKSGNTKSLLSPALSSTGGEGESPSTPAWPAGTGGEL